MRRGPLLIIMAVVVAALQIGFLFWSIAGRAAILRNGTEIALTLAPVDPRDLLRGDYVTLTYNISRLPRSLFADAPQDSGLYRENTVYVRLKRGEDGIWLPVAASVAEPVATPPSGDEVDIRGRANVRRLTDRQIFVSYGIERYYVPEGEGRALETNPEFRSFIMRVAVASDGAAQIKALYDGDELIYTEPLY